MLHPVDVAVLDVSNQIKILTKEANNNEKGLVDVDKEGSVSKVFKTK